MKFFIPGYLIFSFLLTFVLSIPALGQNDPLQKRISLHLGNVTVGSALAAIETETGYEFIYSSSLINTDKAVKVSYSDTPLIRILQDLLGDAAKGMTVAGKQIKIQPSAGKGTVTGTVSTSDGKPAGYVTVSIPGQRSTQADVQGRFRLENVESGSYVLTASYVGLQTQRQSVTVPADGEVSAVFTLSEDAQTLQEVVVNAGRVNKFADKETEYVARMPLKNLENAQVYNVVTQAIMKEQIITDYASATQNVAGMPPLYRSYSNGYQSLVRGFYPKTFLNGLAAPQAESIDPVNIEQVEVLKGPSGTLFGSGAFGGVINNVTKKPQEETAGEVAFSTGSWGLSRLTLDYNQAVNKDKTFLFRLNAARHRERTFQDYGYKNTDVVAPSLAYHVNDRLSLYLDGTFYFQKSSMWQWASFGPDVTIRNIKDLKIPYNRSFAGDQMGQDWNSSAINAKADYKISKSWTSSTNFTQTQYLRKESFYMNGNQWINDSTLSRFIMGARPQHIDYSQLQQNFTGDFRIGNLRNRLVAGLDLYMANLNSTFIYSYTDVLVMNDPDVNVNVSREDILKSFEGQPTLHIKSRSNTYSAYASDVLNITDQLIAMASLRIDRFDNKDDVQDGAVNPTAYKQTALSPKFGLVYQLVKDQVSLFGNYMNSFENNSPQYNNTEAIVYKPSQANQWEGGVKADTWGHKLSVTLSYYDISVKNALRTDPGVPYSVQDGTQYSRGLEAELIVAPLPGLNINAGYGYNHSRYDRASSDLEGKSLGAPANVANLWVSYHLTKGRVKGLGLGIGGNYVSDIYASDPILIPAYTLVNGTVFYDQPKYRIGFKLNNITNEKYWSFGFINPEPPRNYVVNVAYKF